MDGSVLILFCFINRSGVLFQGDIEIRSSNCYMKARTTPLFLMLADFNPAFRNQPVHYGI